MFSAFRFLIVISVFFPLLLSPLIVEAQDNAAIENSSFISVGDRIHAMDKDSDGMVSVYEVRAFIEARHGKAYKQDVLNDMESSADGKSCNTPFAKPLY